MQLKERPLPHRRVPLRHSFQPAGSRAPGSRTAPFPTFRNWAASRPSASLHAVPAPWTSRKNTLPWRALVCGWALSCNLLRALGYEKTLHLIPRATTAHEPRRPRRGARVSAGPAGGALRGGRAARLGRSRARRALGAHKAPAEGPQGAERS